jgi:hypothetical protein
MFASYRLQLGYIFIVVDDPRSLPSIVKVIEEGTRPRKNAENIVVGTNLLP